MGMMSPGISEAMKGEEGQSGPQMPGKGSPTPTQPSTTPAPLPSALPPTPDPSRHMDVDQSAAPMPAMAAPPPSALSALPPHPNQSVNLPSPGGPGGFNPMGGMISALQGHPWQNQQHQNPFQMNEDKGFGGFGGMRNFG